MNKSKSLQNLVVEAKIPEADLEQILTIIQDGTDPKGAVSTLADRLKIKPNEVESSFSKQFGKTPTQMSSELKRKDD